MGIMKTFFICLHLLVLYSLQKQQSSSYSQCRFGHFLSLNTNSCTQCLLSCPTCTYINSPCTNCSQGYKINTISNQCVSCKQGQLWCQNSQLTCQPFYRNNGSNCIIECYVHNCEHCPSVYSKICVTCQMGYKLSVNKTYCEGRKQQGNNSNILNVCGRNQYINGQQCMACDYKCQTCIKTADQCLICAQQWIKIGWKCISKQHMIFNIVITQLGDSNTCNINQCINEIKQQIITNLLPIDYAYLQGMQAISLNQTIKFNKRSINVSGYVSKISNLKINEISQYINKKSKQLGLLGRFQILSLMFKIGQYQSKLSGQQKYKSDDQYKYPQDLYPLGQGLSLAKILIPSIAIGLSLVICLICGICNYLKCCFFRSQSKSKEENQIQTDRNQLMRQKRSAQPGIIQISPVAPPQEKVGSYTNLKTITSINSINFSENLAPPPPPPPPPPMIISPNIAKLTSLDSLEQYPSKQQKIVFKVNDELKDSHLGGNQVRNIMNNSNISNKKDKQSKIVNNELNQNVRYSYVNEKKEQVSIKKLPSYMKDSKYLQEHGIKVVKE